MQNRKRAVQGDNCSDRPEPVTRAAALVMRFRLIPAILLTATVLANPAVDATGTDLHWLWDDRCADCHGHAGNFARKFLGVSGGELHGPHHAHDLRRFLHNHYLAGNEVDAVYTMLLAQANSQTRFRDECGTCHGTASGFVRDSLELRNGTLYSRASGRPVQGFLEHHRNLQPDDVDFFMQLLTRVAREVYRP